MKQKYIGWFNYWCQEIGKEDRCITFYAENKPEPGIINSGNPLPQHSCGKYNYSQECENEPNCRSQVLIKATKSTPELERRYKPIQTTSEIKTRKENSQNLVSIVG
ncbi:hypothetical protein A3K73_03575 [Candidatus Pacearchaeota archaeon RBG_13_36_9]|nr:MAG: hypothetical protein A3K73_03575 [Candidatus Pacearchaeota archaeon RBG_13_36_9]